MSDSFAACAIQWVGLSARVLGWRPDEFWTATPADLRNAFAEPGHSVASLTRDDLGRLIERDNHG